jgi:adenylate cyclase
MLKQAGRQLIIGLAVGLLCGVMVYLLHYPSRFPGSHLLWRLELLSYDWRVSPRDGFVDDIVIVAIDKESAVSIQAWPWPRSFHARMIDRLQQAGAKAIGFDIVFSTLSNTEVPENWLEDPQPSADDQQLVAALQRSGKVVLAALMQEAASERGEVSSEMVSAEFPHWRFEEAAAAAGIVNFPKDVDSTIRRMHLQHEFQDEIMPSFAATLQAVAQGRPPGPAPGTPLPHRYLPGGTRLISYAGPARTFTTVPYYQALDPTLVPDEIFRHRIVIIGATDALLQDIHTSPMSGPEGRDMAGVEIQANSLATLLRGDDLHPLPLVVTLLVTVACGLAGGVSTALLRPVRALWMVLLPILVLAVWLPLSLMQTHLLWVPMVAPLVALSGAYGIVTVFMYVAEERARRALKAAWGRRVAPEILAVILKRPDMAHMQGRRTVATTLFSDIRGFTSMCDDMEPEQVVEILNEYLTEMTIIIRRHRGTIHKFIGDGIMAVFGDPLPDETHADEAVQAAREMHQRLEQMKRDRPDSLVGSLQIGVGIHSGPLVAGDIGSAEFMEYTVIGSTVNVASRLESLNKELKTGIIISDATRQLLTGEYELRDLGVQEIRGVSESLSLFAVNMEAGGTTGDKGSAL